MAAWQSEERAFHRLVPALLPTHRGQYVAVHNGQVIDHGPDQIEVAKRVYAQVGYVPVYVGLVTDVLPPPVRVPSPRRLRGSHG
jgi:hypothetical protein